MADISDDMLFLARSKTDQAGEGVDLYIPKAYREAVLGWRDTVLNEMGDVQSYVFLGIHRSGKLQPQVITRISAGRIVKETCAEIGIKAAITGHSFRVGMAQSLAEYGCGLVEIQQAGRWKTPTMPAYYNRKSDARRGAIARFEGDVVE